MVPTSLSLFEEILHVNTGRNEGTTTGDDVEALAVDDQFSVIRVGVETPSVAETPLVAGSIGKMANA
jgi:hypothetical protein